MTLPPNTPITQENAALLKAGDWVADGPVIGKLKGRADGWGCANLIAPNGSEFSRVLHKHHFTYIGPDLGDGWIGWGGGLNPYGTKLIEVRHRSGIKCLCEADAFEALGWEWSESDPHATDILAFRPALAKPAEGEDAITKRVNEQIIGWERVHGFDMPVAKYATPTPPSVDWAVVGPKLVEALKRAVDDDLGDNWKPDARADGAAQ